LGNRSIRLELECFLASLFSDIQNYVHNFENFVVSLHYFLTLVFQTPLSGFLEGAALLQLLTSTRLMTPAVSLLHKDREE
jgi:hypothetical protein